MARVFALMAALALVAAACGDTATTTAPTSPPATTAPTTTEPPATTAPATTAPATTAPTTTASTTTTSTTTTTVAPTTTVWIGDPIDFWVPQPAEGPIIGVVGVRANDRLNVRAGPGISFGILTTLAPTQDGIVATGRGWQLPSGSVWWEITSGGVTGWANQRFLSRFAGVDDVTSQVVAQLGEIPVAETMLDLGLIVANALAYSDEDFTSTIIVVEGPTVGDLGEIKIDVIGLADDSVGGFRLHIFGQPTEGGEGFSLMAVESWTMCMRGVSGDLCV